MKSKYSRILSSFIILVLAIVADQWTKLQAVSALKGKPGIPIIPGVFELSYVENHGAAFGILQGKQGFFFLTATIVTLVVIYCLLKLPLKKRFLPFQLCLVLLEAGALGNLIDRITQRYVVDFLYFSLIDFPVFNVADCYVTVSVLILVILLMFFYKEDELHFLSFSSSREDNENETDL